MAVEKEVAALIKSKKLTTEDQAVIHAWIQQISTHGPESIRGDFKWADHALHGEWACYRSSGIRSINSIFRTSLKYPLPILCLINRNPIDSFRCTP